MGVFLHIKPFLCTRRHAAHPVSVPTLHPREIPGISCGHKKPRHRDTTSQRSKGSRQCNAMPSYWTRHAQHTHASNSDALKETKTKDKKERKEQEVFFCYRYVGAYTKIQTHTDTLKTHTKNRRSPKQTLGTTHTYGNTSGRSKQACLEVCVGLMREPFAPPHTALHRPVQHEPVNHRNGTGCAVPAVTHLTGGGRRYGGVG